MGMQKNIKRILTVESPVSRYYYYYYYYDYYHYYHYYHYYYQSLCVAVYRAVLALAG